MKKTTNLLILSFFCIIVLFPFKINAQSLTNKTYIGNGIYCITTIEENTIFSQPITPLTTFSSCTTKNNLLKTKTGSKKKTYVNSNGDILWYVKVTGEFNYNGKTSICNTSNVTAISHSNNWKISNKTCKATGNKAIAGATGKLYSHSKLLRTVTRTVTLQCSKTGELS